MKSWRTTAAGIVQFLAVRFRELSALLDNDIATQPNWNLVVASLVILIGFIKAGDEKKIEEATSSRQRY